MALYLEIVVGMELYLEIVVGREIRLSQKRLIV